MSNSPLRVIAFPGAPNLPTFAAIEHGRFQARGFDVELELTPSSIYQRKKLQLVSLILFAPRLIMSLLMVLARVLLRRAST